MLKNYPSLISVLTATELEEFVDDWLDQRYKDYHSHYRWSGTGDLGRDVTGYVTHRRMDGPWDNYQCKQLNTKLSEKTLFVELGKIFMHSAAGAYSLPRSYTFVAPLGVVRKVREYIAHPDKLKQAFLDRWDSFIANDLVENATVKFSPEIEEKIQAFDFTQVHWLDATLLTKDPACMPVLVKWFDADPGQSPRGVVPSAIQNNESKYLSQLIRVYEERGVGPFPTPEAALACAIYGEHLKIQRTRFFDATAFDRFYRESTPADFVENFRHEVLSGVFDVHQDVNRPEFCR